MDEKKLVFTHTQVDTPNDDEVSYIANSAKSISESKIAIDSHTEEGGDDSSERFQGVWDPTAGEDK